LYFLIFLFVELDKMKRVKKLLAIAVLFLTIPGFVRAADFGLVIEQRASFGGVTGSDSNFEYTGVLSPRFSALIGDYGELFISAGIGLRYEYEEWAFIPELLRTEFYWIFNTGSFRVGRMHYSDPLGFITAGLFDGARITFNTMAGDFSAGAWYTGFLFKERANIAMNAIEREQQDVPVDFGNFVDTYFAPRRAIAALDWTHSSVGGGFLRAALSAIGQFDLTGEDLHSQYLAARFTLPQGAFTFNFGGGLGFAQVSGADNQTFFAGEAGVEWILPTVFASQISLLGRYTSGVSSGGGVNAFLPVTTIRQSPILQPGVQGLTMIAMHYAARVNREFALTLSSFYFIRNDLYTNDSYVSIDSNSGHFMGNEFFARFFWMPFSDVHFNLGGGIFLPSM